MTMETADLNRTSSGDAIRAKLPNIRKLLKAKKRMGLTAEVSNREANNPEAAAARLRRLLKDPQALGRMQDLHCQRDVLLLELQLRYGDEWRHRETAKAPRSNRHRG